jgi:hypothetical protein
MSAVTNTKFPCTNSLPLIQELIDPTYAKVKKIAIVLFATLMVIPLLAVMFTLIGDGIYNVFNCANVKTEKPSEPKLPELIGQLDLQLDVSDIPSPAPSPRPNLRIRLPGAASQALVPQAPALVASAPANAQLTLLGRQINVGALNSRDLSGWRTLILNTPGIEIPFEMDGKAHIAFTADVLAFIDQLQTRSLVQPEESRVTVYAPEEVAVVPVSQPITILGKKLDLKTVSAREVANFREVIRSMPEFQVPFSINGKDFLAPKSAVVKCMSQFLEKKRLQDLAPRVAALAPATSSPKAVALAPASSSAFKPKLVYTPQSWSAVVARAEANAPKKKPSTLPRYLFPLQKAKVN